MKARLYLDGHIDVDLPEAIAARLQDVYALAADDPEVLAFDGVAIAWLLDAVSQQARERYSLEPTGWTAVCRGCGCTDEEACPGGCTWIEADLCSRCAPREAATS